MAQIVPEKSIQTKRVLVIEPYYGGSHKAFLDGLIGVVDAEFTLVSLPARKWKMRMQLSAPWFIEHLGSMVERDRFFETVLFSSFIDVAVFRAMTVSLGGWNSQCRYCTYFHENQFEYPGFLEKHTNHQFTAINFTSALASDSIAFNSQFNRTTFLNQCRKYLGKATDMNLDCFNGKLEQKSRVLYPGIDFKRIDRVNGCRTKHRVKRIVWNHRWEHDKNPQNFFDVLYRLADDGIDFELSVLGQNFKNQPACFEIARNKLGDRIVNYGYMDNVDDYYRCLVDGDIVVSTALHEFFGISVLEAVRAGCLPVLPKRLAYPELFDDCYLYEAGGLYERLFSLLNSDERLAKNESIRLTEPYDWQNLASAYAAWLGI